MGTSPRPRDHEILVARGVDGSEHRVERVAQLQRGPEVGDVAGEDGADLSEVLAERSGPHHEFVTESPRRASGHGWQPAEPIEARWSTRQGGERREVVPAR